MYFREPLLPRLLQTTATTNLVTLRPLPLSHLAFTLISDAAASFDPIQFNQLIPRDLTRITLQDRQNCIIDIRGDDLCLLNALKWGYTPHSPMRGGNNVTARVTQTALLPLGRRLYDPNECLPAKPTQSLTLTYQLATPIPALTNREVSIEAVYLPQALPTQHLRYQHNLQPDLVVSPNNDITLPLGNTILGLLLEQGSPATIATTENTIQELTILADNVTKWFRQTEWNALWAETQYRQALRWIDGETSIENTAAAYTQDAETREIRSIAGAAGVISPNYAYIDFDPLLNTTHAIETTQFREILLRINAGQATQIRIIPIELVKP